MLFNSFEFLGRNLSFEFFGRNLFALVFGTAPPVNGIGFFSSDCAIMHVQLHEYADSYTCEFASRGNRKMSNVVEQARSLIGRISRHRSGARVVAPRSHNPNACRTNSGSLVGRVEPGLESTGHIGGPFGKYYLEKISYLEPRSASQENISGS